MRKRRSTYEIPYVPTGTRLGKKALALFLSLAMCLPMLPTMALADNKDAATTDEYGFDLSTPSSFHANDGNQPFGRGAGIKGNLNPTKEISIMESRGDSYSSRVYDFDESSILKGSSGGVFSSSDHYAGLDGTKFSTAAAMKNTINKGEASPYYYVSAVAYDPTGSGRDDKVAYWGAWRKFTGNDDYKMKLYAFNKNNGSFNTGTHVYEKGNHYKTEDYSWMSKLNGYNAEGYTAITAGDFNGNGKETLVFYDPAKGNLQLRENGSDTVLNIGNDSTLKNYFGKTLNDIQALGGSDLQRIAENTAMVQLEAADLDGKADNKDELIVTISLGNLYGESGIKELGSVVMVLSKNGNDSWKTVWSYQFSHVYAADQPTNKYDAGWHLRAAASRAEDIDNDGAMEIVTAGVGADDNNVDDNYHNNGYFAVITDYTGNGYKVDTTTQTFKDKDVSCQSGIYVKQNGDKNNEWVGTKGDDLWYMNPCSLGIVRFDGRGTVPYIVIRGQIFKYNGSTLEAANIETDGLNNVLKDRTIINQPIVGNFDGNAAGREQILFTLSSGDGSAVNIGGYYYKPSDYDTSKGTGSYQSTGKGKSAMNDISNDSGEGLRSCRWGMNAWSISEIALAAPDIDSDGIIADYQGKAYAFNDPQVLAVMEAPPYFEDIEYNNAGETAISFSKGSGSSTGTSTANRIGTYVSFSQDFSVGGIVDLGGFEFETAFEAEWNNSIEIEQSFTMTNSFSAEQAESAVVLICIPVTIYHYNTTSADGSKSTMDITVADAPTYKTIPLSEYNAAAAQRGDPEIGSDIIASTAGQPSTYRSTTTGLKNAVTTSKGTNGGWFATESGESSKSQSVAFETSQTTTKELTFNIDAKGGGGLGGFKFGLSGGSSSGSSASSISTEGIERSGTVHDLPSGTTGYSFQWQFVGWETTLSTGGLSYNVPVLSYLVANVKQPPSKPQNLEAKEVTTNSVTLEWESGFTTAAQYQVYRYMPNNTTGTKYALLGTVSGLAADQDGKYTLTDTKVQPSTQYQYVLKSVGTDGTSTDYTEPLAVTTLATGDKPNITQQPQDTSVRPGTNATFTISATPTGGAGSVTYRWQSRTDGGRWTDLNQDAPTLTIEKPAKSMSGTEYRCIVSQTDLNTEKSSVVYSNTVKLTVGKAGSETALETSGTGGSATHETAAGETTKTVTAQYNISGKTYQKYDNAYIESDKITGDVFGGSDSTGYHYYTGLTAGTESDANGVYTVSGTAVALTAAEDRVTLNKTAYKIGDNGFRKTQKTETINGAEYKVYTAIGVGGEAGKTETLTLYCKDGKYYRKDSNGNPVEMTGKTTIDGEVTNTYRTDSLTPVYVTENGYAVLTYTTESENPTTLTIYELNGTYYSKSESTYTSLSLVTGLYQNTDGKLFKPGAAVTTEVKTTGSKTQVTGDTVTLTAQVSVKDSGSADNGTVTFEITNTTTGSVVRYPVNKSSGNSPVECKWTPSEAGVYSIVAIFGGNSETNGSRSGAVTYYAKAADDLYEISVSDCTYGDTISPSLKSVTINGTTSPEKTGVTYAAYKDGSSAVTNWESGKTLVPGTYRITAAAEGKVLASKYITVSKKPITITAPTEKGGSITFTDKDGNVGFVNDDDYKSLFKTEGIPTDKDPAGVYNVSVVYDESIDKFADKQAEFFSKYTPMLKNSMVLVQADTFTVTYSNSNNGTLKGYQGSYSTSFTSGAKIASGSNVIFAATPAENYQVWKWTVKSDGQELTKGSDYTLSDDNKTLTVSSLQKNLDVHVAFSNQFYTVSAQSDTYGSVTATANGNPLAATSVLSGTEVTFTAAPKAGYVVKQWTVKRGSGTVEIQKNTDGTVFSGRELKLTITADTTVNVTFEKTEQYTVRYSAVAQSDPNKTVVLNFETTGLTDGKGEKGSTVTLTAKPSPAMGIAGWQYKTSESGTWTNTSVTGLNYTIRNLQSDIWVRALVNDSATATKIHFGIVSGDSGTGGGTLTAKYTANGAEIQNNADCTTYSSITFTYEEPTAYEVVGWKVNNEPVTANRNGDSKTFTYTIDSLTTETTVNMVVRVKPIVTVTPPTNGTTNNTLDVTYTLNGETVKPETENGKQYVYSGTTATVTATPNTNYVVTDVKADSGSSISTTPNRDKANGVQTLTVAEINADTTFSATFVEKPVVTIKPGENGLVEVKGTVNGKANTTLTSGTHVDFGTDLIVTATPESGYVVNTINGAAVNADKANSEKTKTIAKVGGNTEITATFLAKPKVTISTAAGGTVEVKGTVDGTKKTLTTGNYVDFGTSLTVTLAPDTGYEVGSMDDVSPAYTDGTGTTTDNKSYTISGVDKNQTITPVWSAIPTTTVNWSVIDKTPDTNGGTDGTLKATVTRKGMSNYAVTDSTAGTFPVYRDSVVTFTATPDTGYKTGVWQLNGKRQDSQPKLTITKDTTSPQTVQVQFDPLGDKVTYGFKEDSADAAAHKAQLTAQFKPNSGTEGKFESGTTPTTDGSITFTVSDLDNGYKVEGWYVDGSKQSGETGTTFTHKVTHNIGMDVQVKIVRKSYTVNFSATNGTVTAAAGSTKLATGDSVVGDTSVTFTAAPKSTTGYTFDGWTVNGEKSVETSETLTLPITKNTTVSVAYTLNTVSYAVNYGVISDSEDTTNGTLTAKNGTKTFDSGAEQPAGSTIVFTAQPKDGYQVKGWYKAAEGGSAIPDTTSEQNSYTITNLTDEATVYVAFEPIPTYDITLSTTGLGHVTATVNGKNTDITDGKLTVSRHDNVVLTAVPDANQYLTGWTLDGKTKGNSSLSLTLDDVTDGHTVKADFAASQLVTLKTVCGENGTLTAKAGYGDTLETVDASSESGIQVEKGKKVVLTVVPTTGYMVKMWTVNGTIQNNLSNTFTIENLSENTEIEVAFEPYAGFVIPTSDNGWTVSDVKRTPDNTTPVTEIRKNGTVTFTVSPESGKYLTALKVNGTDCLAAISNDGNENKLTVVNNQNGSYTITVANVTNNIALEATSLQFRTEKTELTVPEVLKEKYADTDALKTALQIALRTQVDKVNASVPAANIQYYDIKLQYTTDGGETWIDATKEHFPAGGITVQIPYSELKSGLDRNYTYTVIHMFTTDMKGHEIGKTESITPTNGEDGISFTVNSLSPFAIGWYKNTAPMPGGGGGGGGAVAPTTYDVVIPAALANIVKADKPKAAAGDTVTLTVSGEGTLTVTDANGKSVALTDLGSGKYAFKMPSSKVNVAFAASGETKPCDGGKDCPSAPFKDVDTGKWYHVSIDYVLTHSMMNGVSGTSFAPNSNLTRGMLVQILFNLEGKPQSASASFSDVKADAWYAKAVGWAAANKVVTGYADGTFRPNAAVTREQAAAILYRYAQSKGIDVNVGEDTNILSYADALQASEYAIPALQWAVGAGVLNGKSGNLLAPTGTATRAEIAAIMQRWCEKIVQK